MQQLVVPDMTLVATRRGPDGVEVFVELRLEDLVKFVREVATTVSAQVAANVATELAAKVSADVASRVTAEPDLVVRDVVRDADGRITQLVDVMQRKEWVTVKQGAPHG